MDPEQLKRTLELLYREGQHNRDKVTTIQNWTVTVWIATLGWTLTKTELAHATRIALPFAALVAFWVVAGLNLAFSELDDQRVLRIERAIVDGTLAALPAEEFHLALGHEQFGFRDKAVAMLRSLFLRESITVFYVNLLTATWFVLR